MRFAQKLYYLFFGFFTVLFVCMVLYVYWIQSRGIKNQLRQTFESLSEELARSSQSLIRNFNEGMLYNVLYDQVAQKNVANRLRYLRILNDHGIIFYSYNNEQDEGKISTFVSDKGIVAQLEQSQAPSLTRILTNETGQFYDVSIPFSVFQIRYVLRVGFYYSVDLPLYPGIFLMLFTFLGLLVVLFVLIVARIIIKPVEALTHEAHQIARGVKSDFLSTRLRDDEIGDLARSLRLLLKLISKIDMRSVWTMSGKMKNTSWVARFVLLVFMTRTMDDCT